ncbi:MAG: thioesterase family protein [Anaerolineaceae bacterium]|nr:thioesterase family protein [Anaerolineaceae bacterium]
MIPLENIAELPSFHRATIVPEYLDAMGHMNIRWYMAIFDDAAWKFFDHFGMNIEYYQREQAGGFALQHFIRYLAEVRLGETVAIHTRILGRSAKRIHFMHFMVNETTGVLAATLEVLGSHADMRVRRTSPYPPYIAEKIDAILQEHTRLNWEAPVCGVIQP